MHDSSLALIVNGEERLARTGSQILWDCFVINDAYSVRKISKLLEGKIGPAVIN
jgi:hypothetical protein